MLTIELLKAEQSQLEAELAQFEPKRRRLGLIKELIQTYSGGDGQRVLIDAPSVAPPKRYAGLGTTEAIRAFVYEQGAKFSSPREIAKALMEGGHNSMSPNFFNIVYTICKRKGESGEFEASEESGRRKFRGSLK